MTAAPPTSVVARPGIVGSHFYGQGSGKIYDALGAQVAGQLLVAVAWGGQGNSGGESGLLETPVLEIVSGGIAQEVQNFTDAGASETDLFSVSWAQVPAAAAGDTSLRVSTGYWTTGRNLVVDTQIMKWDGADPNVLPVGAYTGEGGWSTPSMQCPFDGVTLHVFCQQNYGQSVPLDPFGEYALAPYSNFEFDGSVPLQVSGCSVVQDQVAGPTNPIPQTYAPGSIPSTWNWGSGQVPGSQAKAAVLCLPLRRGDSCGELVT